MSTQVKTDHIFGIEKDDKIYANLVDSGVLDHLTFFLKVESTKAFIIGGTRVDISNTMFCESPKGEHTKLHYKDLFFDFYCPPETLEHLSDFWAALGQASMYELPASMA